MPGGYEGCACSMGGLDALVMIKVSEATGIECFTALWSAVGAGAATLGVGFIFKAFVKSGIEEAVKLNFKRHLEDYRSQLRQEIEYLRSSLKNAEAIFVRQLEALTHLRRFLRGVVPKPPKPDADWTDACEEIAHSFPEHADAIDEFLANFGAILPQSVLEKIERAASLANEAAFFAFGTNLRTGEIQPTVDGVRMADDFYDLLKSAVSEMQQVVDSQVAGRANVAESGRD